MDKLEFVKAGYKTPEILKDLIVILQTDVREIYKIPSNKSCDILLKVDSELLNTGKLDLKVLDEIRKELLDIYHNPGNHVKKNE
ncbi:MAG: hypothetical protein UR12_C0006G0017 [candidate division TM6 bacterium GW2011_GWF2_30_66]|nr:MAG: hypothetical protein UR12_C0006G0017 [candidate division TM6 bacterium GW2011_GWF2_30_66]